MLDRNDVSTSAPIHRERSPAPDRATALLEATARELLGPLWALDVRSSVLRRPADLTPRERELLDFVGVQARRMARVLGGVLDALQAERRAGPPVSPRPCELAEICEAAVEELREGGFSGRISYEGAGDGAGEWDPERLAQALSYLVEAAAAGVAPGEGVALRWRGGDDEVVVRVEAGRCGVPFRIDPEWGEAPGEDAAGAKAFLARAVAVAHGGLLARFTADGATSFVLALPRRAPEDAHRGTTH